MTRSVVFAYHNIGVRCLRVLLAHDVDIALVVTHEDNPSEKIWFQSVAAVARECDLPCIAPKDPDSPAVVAQVAACQPDFIFSFYYRHMISPSLLALARRGALNMHGSMLPKYRGRVPVNWAIIHGETETGATLHYMVEKPDAGDIIAQSAVPILPDDTAKEVFDKVTVAAELTLDRILPALVAGSAPRMPQDASRATYFGGRKPEDGIIDWSQNAAAIHNLVRALAPPYPGARTLLSGTPLRLLRTRILDAFCRQGPAMAVEGGRIVAYCGGGGKLGVLELEVDGQSVDAGGFQQRLGSQRVPAT